MFTFAICLINFDKGYHTLGTDHKTFQLVLFEKFVVVAEFASFVGDPVWKQAIDVYTQSTKNQKKINVKEKIINALPPILIYFLMNLVKD